MSKATIEFNLPEEDHEFKCAIRGVDIVSGLQELDNWLRNNLKYEELSPESYGVYQEIRDKLHQCVENIWDN
jgi:hypothetical protein